MACKQCKMFNECERALNILRAEALLKRSILTREIEALKKREASFSIVSKKHEQLERETNKSS